MYYILILIYGTGLCMIILLFDCRSTGLAVSSSLFEMLIEKIK